MSRKQDRLKKTEAIGKEARKKELIFRLKPLLYAFASWFVVIGILHLPPLKEAVMIGFIDFTTYSTFYLGKLLMLPVEVTNPPLITVDGFRMRVVMECTGYNFYILVLAISIFSRWQFKHRVFSAVVMLFSVFLLNFTRFITMGYIGSRWPSLFDSIHDYLWNILFGFMVFAIWLWMEQLHTRKIFAK